MSNELIRPIDAETAAAIEASAKLGTDIVGAVVGGGSYLDRVVGRLPDNLVGLLIGDWVTHKRVRRWVQLQAETEKILLSSGVTKPFDEVSPSIAIPLIEAAIDEDRDGLRQLWEHLLASACDPVKKHLIRPSLIAALKQFDPADAKTLLRIAPNSGKLMNGASNFHHINADIAQHANISVDDAEISVSHLKDLNCITVQTRVFAYPETTAFGRLLLKVVS